MNIFDKYLFQIGSLWRTIPFPRLNHRKHSVQFIIDLLGKVLLAILFGNNTQLLKKIECPLQII